MIRLGIIMFLTLGATFGLSQNTPGVRNGHSMVYHNQLKGVFLFGGADELQVRSDTWLLKNTNWQLLSTDGPEARTFSSMVYCSGNKEVILFGGNKVLFGKDVKSNTLLNDTWKWKDNKWFKVVSNLNPEPRSEATMAYDEATGDVVLFGGFKYDSDGKTLIRLDDTWIFRNGEWRQLNIKGPSARSGSTMAYDNDLKRVTLFGGNFKRGNNRSITNSTTTTWFFKNYMWDSTTSKSPNLYNTAMAYDKSKKQLIHFGGWNGTQRVNETWSFSENKWMLLSFIESPEPRNHCIIVYNQKRKSIILFGGHNGDFVLGDVWELKNQKWVKLIDVLPLARVENGH